MKNILITILFITIFTNCSTNNAFSHFTLDSDQAKSEDTLQSSKIVSESKKNEGIISVIYLNNVFPKTYNTKEYFYIHYYLKESSNTIDFFLNNKSAQESKELESKNRFSDLTSFKGAWQKYLLVTFEKQEKDVLVFKAKTSDATSREIIFRKEN